MIYAPTLALPLQPRTTASTTCNCAGGKKSSGYSFMWGDPSIPRWCHVYFGFYGSGRTSKLIYLQRLDMCFLLYHLLREVIKWSIDEKKVNLLILIPIYIPTYIATSKSPESTPCLSKVLSFGEFWIYPIYPSLLVDNHILDGAFVGSEELARMVNKYCHSNLETSDGV